MAQQWPPKRAAAFTVSFPIFGPGLDPVTGVLGLDSEISKDGGAFADCTNEAVEIGTSGIYTLALTAAEMTADQIMILVKTTSYGTWPIRIETAESTWDEGVDAKAILAGGIATTSFVAGAIDANAIATDAIGANELAASAVTEIQSGLGTAASIATLQADTDDIQTRIPAVLVGGRMDSSVGAMAAGVLTAAAMAADALAAIKTQIVNALSVDTYAEPGQGTPAATNTIAVKLGYMFKAFRNKITQTETQLSLYNDDGVTVDQKATVSDDGATYTRSELSSGP